MKYQLMEKLKLGDAYETTFAFSQEEVSAFAMLTGDKNPVHLDPAYAATTVFRKPIMHGMLAACIFSKVLGMEFPGEGTVYLGQTLDFKRPMYPSETYIAVFKVIEVNEKRGLATIQCTIWEETRKRVMLEGQAKIRNKERIKIES